jgi:cytochrome c5
MKKFLIILLAGMMACSSSSKIKKTAATTSTTVQAKDTTATTTTTTTTTVTTTDPEFAKAMVKVPGITSERLIEGNKIYMQDCTRCHAMKEPSNYTPEQWEPILLRMFVKAKLSDEHEKTLIRDYVMAKSK